MTSCQPTCGACTCAQGAAEWSAHQQDQHSVVHMGLLSGALTNETSIGGEEQCVAEDQQLRLLPGFAPPPHTHTGSLSLRPQPSHIPLAPVQAPQQNAQHYDEHYHTGGRPLQPQLLQGELHFCWAVYHNQGVACKAPTMVLTMSFSGVGA